MLYEGVEKYEMPGVRSFVNEKNLKFNYIEKIREQKVALKTYKIRNITEHVEDELGKQTGYWNENIYSVMCGV